MREKKYNNEWIKKEYLKGRSSNNIAIQVKCTGANIIRILRVLGVKRRNRVWTESERDYLLEASRTKTFKEISNELSRTYDAIRIQAIKMQIQSIYDPAAETKKRDVRIKISSSLQRVKINEWNGFKESTNKLIRKSVPYQEWRKAVFERDNYRCVKCGKGGYLHADHKQQFALFPDLRLDIHNGQTLCRKCHMIKTIQERLKVKL